jgi:predicted ATPase/class 3 adenylate cyclase
MRGCLQCGERNDDRSRFCWACGAPLHAGTATAREARKTVTALFCDVVGSTSIGEREDPERLHWLMSRFFEEMGAIVERHGGTVGKFIGDAVMAVFGTPVLHEDDALRAVRAAAEMRAAMGALNDELERFAGVRLQVRIGINTGPVMVGDPSRSENIATGDAVNTAKRLETSAGPGEILIGEETRRLARDAIVAEELPPLAVKGKARLVRAYRLIEAGAGGRERRSGSPFVDRERERALVHALLDRIAGQRACHLLTMIGEPGVGKSRLIAEAVAGGAHDVTVLEGSCLPYGEGITFWPVVEIIRAAAHAEEGDRAEDVRGKLASLLAEAEIDPIVADAVGQLLGGPGERTTDELFWAVRKLLETIARGGSLVVVFDDIHWGEATLLDLIEHIADWSRDAPILVVCIARPELLEVRPRWGESRPNATSMLLEPLGDRDSEQLIGALVGSAALPEHVANSIRGAAEGYPLFVEEMVSMLMEEGILRRENGGRGIADDAARVRVPATINLLLASRIDRLPDDERQVLEWASVEGRVFHVGAVRHLAPAHADPGLDDVLDRLARKALVLPERSQVPGEDAFRFRHILIREAAYDAIPKQARAELHERFAAWLTSIPGDDPEFVGYHLERAFLYRRELRHVQQTDRRLAGDAGRHLATAGIRARRRGDVAAAVKLLDRAVDLLREDGEAPAEDLIELACALVDTGDLSRADGVFTETLQLATRRNDVWMATRAELERAFVRLLVDPAYDAHQLRDVAEASIPVFERMGDEAGLATALRRVADAHWLRCRCADAERVLEEALVHAERAGDQREVSELLAQLGRAVVFGPRPVSAASRRCRQILDRSHGQPRLDAWIKSMLGVLEAMDGNSERAEQLCRESQRVLADLGLKVHLAGAWLYAGMAELVGGDADAAEREFRRGYAAFVDMGERAQLSTMAALLARALIAQGRYDEVEQLTLFSEQAASEDDLASQVLWRATRARVYAVRGEHERAEALARDAVARAGASDLLNTQADVVVDLAHVVRAVRPAEADAVLAEALSLYETKGNVRSAAHLRDLRAAWLAAPRA